MVLLNLWLIALPSRIKLSMAQGNFNWNIWFYSLEAGRWRGGLSSGWVWRLGHFLHIEAKWYCKFSSYNRSSKEAQLKLIASLDSGSKLCSIILVRMGYTVSLREVLIMLPQRIYLFFSAEWLTRESHELLLLGPEESCLVAVTLKTSHLLFVLGSL